MAERVTTPERARRRSGGGRMVLALFLLGGLLGVVAFWRFTKSDRFIQRSLAEVRKRAAVGLSPEACVNELLTWSRRCDAMKDLCDGSIPRVMEACLQGRDRHAYCASLGDRYRATSFGVPECRAHVKSHDRSGKRVCALGYRGIARHCERLRRLEHAGGV